MLDPERLQRQRLVEDVVLDTFCSGLTWVGPLSALHCSGVGNGSMVCEQCGKTADRTGGFGTQRTGGTQEAEIAGFGARVYEIRRAQVCLGIGGHAGGALAGAAVSLESDRCSHAGALDEIATGGGVGIRNEAALHSLCSHATKSLAMRSVCWKSMKLMTHASSAKGVIPAPWAWDASNIWTPRGSWRHWLHQREQESQMVVVKMSRLQKLL